MKKILLLSLLMTNLFMLSNAQSCPDGPNGVRWLSSGSGLFIMDWSTANEAQVMLDNLVSISVSDGVATVGTYAAPNPALNFTAEPVASWRVVNGPGTSQRIRPDDGTLYANGAGNNSSMTGQVTFNLSVGGPIVCDYIASVLPISLSKFEAKLSNNQKVSIEWQTESEINNDYMIVEKSVDGKNFEEVGKVYGAGTSSNVNDYKVIDENPSKGNNYYRLRQVDFDGDFYLSEIVEVSLNRDMQELNLYPTLVEDHDILTIELNELEASSLNIDIYNLQGQLMQSHLTSGAEELSISVYDLESGFYIVKAEKNNTSYFGRFIKK